MAEVTNALIYEVLGAMQEGLRRVEGKLDEVKGEITAIRTYIYAGHQDIGRLERIEKRLELREAERA